MFKIYYLEDAIFRSALENYINNDKRISAGYDGELKMYYIKEL